MFTDVSVDFVLNGRVHGELGENLHQEGMRFDPGFLRPFMDERGRKCVTINTGRMETRKKPDGSLITNKDGSARQFAQTETHFVAELKRQGMDHPVWNAATSLRKDEWITIDRAVMEAKRARLRAWADLAASNTYGNFNGMATMILEHETASDSGEALVDMDGMTEGRSDTPVNQLEGIPLPITHSGFQISQRRLLISRKGGRGIDTLAASNCGRRVVEMIEKTTIGIETGVTYGRIADYGRTPTVYGYTNFPPRITKSDMTAPTGTNGEAVLTSWLTLRELLYDSNHFGPYMIYLSRDWDLYLDNLFSSTEPSAGTLRKRLLEVDGILGIRRLDYLTSPFTVLMVQMTEDVARAIVGMDLTTLQWESVGGLRQNFKTMAIMVPQLRADFYDQTGIAHGVAA